MSLVGMREFMSGGRLQYFMLALAVVFAVGIVGIGIGSGRGGGGREEQSGIIATVNGQKLERKEFEFQVMRTIDQMGERRVMSPFEEAQLRGQIFDQLVDQTLRIQAAEKDGVKVSKRDIKAKTREIVDQQIEQFKAQIFADYKGKKTDKAFDTELKKRTGQSVSEVRKDIEKSIDAEMVRVQLLMDKHQEKIKGGVEVSEDIVKASYDELHLRQITVGSSGRSLDQAEQRAKEIAEKIRGGTDFAAAAKEFSDDPFKSAGGDRNFVRTGDLEKPLAEAAAKLKPGEMSDVISLGNSYAIVKLEAQRSGLPEDFDDPKKKKEYVDNYKSIQEQRALNDFETKLQEQAKILVVDPELKAYRTTREIAQVFNPEDPEAMKAKIRESVKGFEKAIDQASGDPHTLARCYSQIAYLHFWMRNPGFFQASEEEIASETEAAKKALTLALDYAEANDLRLMLAEILVDEGNYDAALEHMQFASENAFDDYQTHMQLMALYQQMKAAGVTKVDALIAEEQEWMADYAQRMREMQSMQEGGQIQVTPQGQ